MFSRTKSVLSVVALLATGVACQSGSTPASDRPSPAPIDTVPTGPSGPAPSGPAEPSAANAPAAAQPTTDPGTQPITEPGTAALPAVDPAEAQPVSGTDTAAAAATSAPLNDAQIAAITAGVNSAEIEQAKLAKATSKNPAVRRFATMMIQHHGQAKKKQASLKLDTAESAQSQQLGEEASTTLEALKSKKGAEFDRAYLEAQVEGHQKVLDALDHDLRPQAQSPALQNYLAELEPKVAQHLQSARSAQQALDQNTSAGAQSSTAKSSTNKPTSSP